MSGFVEKSLCIVGRHPALSFAELESLYGFEHTVPSGSAVLLDIDPTKIDFRRLGGSLKLAQVLKKLPTKKWSELEKFLIKNIPAQLQNVPGGSFTLGLSVYDLNVDVRAVNQCLMRIKKIVRASGRSIRVVPNKLLQLNSAQVLHNKLTTRGAWELIIVGRADQTILAQTLFVQDIKAYASRDQARPKRDARVGMLPPKLAQIIVNLAKPAPNSLILDPFCGSGVILQEAALMGLRVIGTDIDPRMIAYSKSNLKWLKARHPELNISARLNVADAANATWPAQISSVASEIYLGKPLIRLPAKNAFETMVLEIDSLLTNFLKNIHPQIANRSRLALAVPAWKKTDGSLITLPIIDRVTDIGYNYLDFRNAARQSLVYSRQNQLVARQLIVISRQ